MEDIEIKKCKDCLSDGHSVTSVNQDFFLIVCSGENCQNETPTFGRYLPCIIYWNKNFGANSTLN